MTNSCDNVSGGRVHVHHHYGCGGQDPVEETMARGEPRPELKLFRKAWLLLLTIRSYWDRDTGMF